MGRRQSFSTDEKISIFRALNIEIYEFLGGFGFEKAELDEFGKLWVSISCYLISIRNPDIKWRQGTTDTIILTNCNGPLDSNKEIRPTLIK